jgi:hypothetical protein
MSIDRNREEKLDALFAAYRHELPDFDGGAEFVPRLWGKIEARRARSTMWTSWSRRLLAGACCAGLVLAGLAMWAPLTPSAYYEASYVETLDDDDDLIVMAALHPASPIVSANE